MNAVASVSRVVPRSKTWKINAGNIDAFCSALSQKQQDIAFSRGGGDRNSVDHLAAGTYVANLNGEARTQILGDLYGALSGKTGIFVGVTIQGDTKQAASYSVRVTEEVFAKLPELVKQNLPVNVLIAEIEGTKRIMLKASPGGGGDSAFTPEQVLQFFT